MNILQTLVIGKKIGKFAGGLPVLLGIAGTVCGLDLLIKDAIETEVEENFPREMPGTGGKIRISRAYNQGFSEGLMDDQPETVRCASIASVLSMLVSLGILCGTEKNKKMKKLGMALALGGAMSNTMDRVIKGKVTDYLNIQAPVLSELIVNIGDIAITAGGFVFLLSDLISSEKEK